MVTGSALKIKGGKLWKTDECVPKFGVHEGIHKKGPYPRSKTAAITVIPAYHSRGTPLYIASALILGHPHECRGQKGPGAGAKEVSG